MRNSGAKKRRASWRNNQHQQRQRKMKIKRKKRKAAIKAAKISINGGIN